MAEVWPFLAVLASNPMSTSRISHSDSICGVRSHKQRNCSTSKRCFGKAVVVGRRFERLRLSSRKIMRRSCSCETLSARPGDLLGCCTNKGQYNSHVDHPGRVVESPLRPDGPYCHTTHVGGYVVTRRRAICHTPRLAQHHAPSTVSVRGRSWVLLEYAL